MLVYAVTTTVKTSDGRLIIARNGNDVMSVQTIGVFSTYAKAAWALNAAIRLSAGALENEYTVGIVTAFQLDS